MHYSTAALVLAVSTISQVAATPHGHQHLHKKHTQLTNERANEEEKRAPVDYSTVDYSDVDWSTVDWSAVDWSTVSYDIPGAAATSAPAAATTTEAAAATTEAVEGVEAAASTTATSAAASATSSDSDSVLGTILSTVDEALLTTLGALTGANSLTNNGEAWIGSDGDYTAEFVNSAGEDVVLVAWGPSGSWINAVAPLITYSLSDGDSITLSFANGHSGALSMIYSDTELVNGQVSNTWLEYTWEEDGVFDVSREVNMNGKTISAVGSECTSDMETCVFVCTSGDSCEYDYELLNCETGSQSGAQYGTYNGAASGGCGGLGSGTSITVTIS